MSVINYACARCGAAYCKLWRQSNTCADSVRLLCVDCAGKDQKRDVSDVDAEGKVADPDLGMRCDQIGWLVPAVPTPDGETFWGYTSVPEEGVVWWKGLPTRTAKALPCAACKGDEKGRHACGRCLGTGTDWRAALDQRETIGR